MFTLVVGGAASGKSGYAEELLLSSPCPPRFYLATMEPLDEGCRARIARHRRMRAGKGFETVERFTNLAGLRLAARGSVLLECLGNLAANELYSPAGAGDRALEALVAGVEALLAQSDTLIVVSNEVFTGGSCYKGDTGAYLRLLARANRALARRAGRGAGGGCGLPGYYKGGAG